MEYSLSYIVAMDTEEMSTEESEVDVEGGGAPAAGGGDNSKMDTEQQATTGNLHFTSYACMLSHLNDLFPQI